ncbi:MAG TPA: hypothetical protein VG983_05380 [Caulobacterales bacterium]|jgi:hypothetical protein|nr:hypothetical protein [Caulobacterales bacterium]
MTDFVPLTILLEPAIDDLLGRMAEDTGTTKEALAIEAINNMVAWVVSGGADADANEIRLESQLEGQLAWVQESIDDFEG